MAGEGDEGEGEGGAEEGDGGELLVVPAGALEDVGGGGGEAGEKEQGRGAAEVGLESGFAGRGGLPAGVDDQGGGDEGENGELGASARSWSRERPPTAQ